MKVEIFYACSAKEMEREINNSLKKSSSKVKDIKLCEFNPGICAMIIRK